MSTIKKALDEIKAYKKGISVDDARRVLEYYGFVNVHTKGSHMKFKHKKYCDLQVTLVANKTLKEYLIDDILDALNALKERDYDAD